MSSLPITSVIAALLTIVMLPLTLQISVRRAILGKASGDTASVTFGDGGDRDIQVKV